MAKTLKIELKKDGDSIGSVTFEMSNEKWQEGETTKIDAPIKIRRFIRKVLKKNPSGQRMMGGSVRKDLRPFYEGLAIALYEARDEFGIEFTMPEPVSLPGGEIA